MISCSMLQFNIRCPFGYMKLFNASRYITEVKQSLTRLYSDGCLRTRWSVVSISTLSNYNILKKLVNITSFTYSSPICI